MPSTPYPPPEHLHSTYAVTLDTRTPEEKVAGVASYYAECYSEGVALSLAKRVTSVGRPPVIWRRRDDRRGWERIIDGVTRDQPVAAQVPRDDGDGGPVGCRD